MWSSSFLSYVERAQSWAWISCRYSAVGVSYYIHYNTTFLTTRTNFAGGNAIVTPNPRERNNMCRLRGLLGSVPGTVRAAFHKINNHGNYLWAPGTEFLSRLRMRFSLGGTADSSESSPDFFESFLAIVSRFSRVLVPFLEQPISFLWGAKNKMVCH